MICQLRGQLVTLAMVAALVAATIPLAWRTYRRRMGYWPVHGTHRIDSSVTVWARRFTVRKEYRQWQTA